MSNTGTGNFQDSDKSRVTRNVGNGVEKTTTDMQNINTFLDADQEFATLGKDNIWDIDDEGIINDGYPYLMWTQDIN